MAWLGMDAASSIKARGRVSFMKRTVRDEFLHIESILADPGLEGLYGTALDQSYKCPRTPDAARTSAQGTAAALAHFRGSLAFAMAGPHITPQFEIHFGKQLLPFVEAELARSELRTLIHPLSLDDPGDHTHLGRWIGQPVELDLTVLDPPGMNQGLARFGKFDC